MELKDLIGNHILDAVDFSNESIKIYSRYEDCQVCRFRLDGITYSAIEDPNDGYRSYLKELIVDENSNMNNIFTPINVIINQSSHEDEIIEFVDSETEKVVLEIGTDNDDDYYPYFTANFYPENMIINKEN